jgi:hypothetical protein
MGIMNKYSLCLAVVGLTIGTPSFGQEEAPAPRSHMKEVLRARADEEASKTKTAPSRPAPIATAPAKGKKTQPDAAPVAESVAAPAPAQSAESKPAAQPVAKGQGGPATVLPKMEVRKSRITETDRQVHLQEQAIAREKKNTKATETDKALNDAKISSVLSVFGGESNKHRESVAQERVSLMETERDIIEAMGHARTKEEKQDLQKQLDEVRATRRELEKLRR